MCFCLVVFAEYNSKSALQVINTNFTFELFICAAILLENRESLLRCQDDVQLIQFTNRFVCRPRHKNHEKEFVHLHICVNMFCLFWQPSGNTGPEQHTEESRAPLLQLLQTLRMGLHDFTL